MYYGLSGHILKTPHLALLPLSEKETWESTNEEKRIIFHSTAVTKGKEGACFTRLREEQSGWSQSGKKRGKENAILTHVIIGLFKSPCWQWCHVYSLVSNDTH